MNIGKPLREINVEPLELPEPIRKEEPKPEEVPESVPIPVKEESIEVIYFTDYIGKL